MAFRCLNITQHVIQYIGSLRFAERRYGRAVYAAALCLFVRLSVTSQCFIAERLKAR